MDIYDRTVEEIRNFNRFYTVSMGFLNSSYLDSDFSIVESRILFEINAHGACSQSEIVKILRIDKSYLSRIVQRFCIKELVEKTYSDSDKRITELKLTEKGKREVQKLVVLANEKIKVRIKDLSFDECCKLNKSIYDIISILGKGEI